MKDWDRHDEKEKEGNPGNSRQVVQLEIVREGDAELSQCKDIKHEHEQVNGGEDGGTDEDDRILGDIVVVHHSHQPEVDPECLEHIGLNSK